MPVRKVGRREEPPTAYREASGRGHTLKKRIEVKRDPLSRRNFYCATVIA